MTNERNLIPVINNLSRQARSLDEAIELFQLLLAGELGGAALLVEPVEDGNSPGMGKAVAAFMESRQFPFRGLYTAPLTVGSRKVGKLIACFGSFGAPGRSLPEVTAHIAKQLSEMLSRTSRAIVPHAVPPAFQLKEAAL